MKSKKHLEEGLKQYKDGKWGINLYVPARFSTRGKRTRLQRKIGSKTEAKIERDRIKLGWQKNNPVHLEVSQAKKSIPIKILVEEWLKGRKNIKREKYIAKQIKEVFGNLLPQNLKKSHIKDYVRSLQELEYSSSTIKSRLSCLRGAIKIAIDKEIVSLDPFSGIIIKLSDKQNARHIYLSKGQEENLLIEAGRYAPYFRFAILTGMRQGEQLSLKWEQVDWNRSLAHLPKTKNGRSRFVPLSEEAIKILEDQREKQNTKILCFPALRGGKWSTSNFRTKVWRPAFNRADLKKARWHDLRHTCASRMVEAGVDLYTVKKVLGHTSISMTERYAHLSPSHLLEAVEKIE